MLSLPSVKMTNCVDEETPLLHAEPTNERKVTPLPKGQIAICLLLQVCEPIASQSIFPYINQVFSHSFVVRAKLLTLNSSSVNSILLAGMNAKLGTTLG